MFQVLCFLYSTLITLPYLPILIRRVCDQNNLEGMYTKKKNITNYKLHLELVRWPLYCSL